MMVRMAWLRFVGRSRKIKDGVVTNLNPFDSKLLPTIDRHFFQETMAPTASKDDENDESIAAIVYSSYGAIHDDELDDETNEAEYEAERQFQYLRQMSAPFISFTEPAYSSAPQGRTAELFLSVRHVYKSSVRDTISKAFQFGGSPSSVRDVPGTATVPNEILNLVKNIVGAGALALPSGVAAFANAPSVLYGAAFWLVFMACIFGYYFLLIGRTCKYTGTSSLLKPGNEPWEKREQVLWHSLLH